MSSVGVVSDVIEVFKVRRECGVDGVSAVRRPGIAAAPGNPRIHRQGR